MDTQKIIVLGTGGTIAGTAASSSDHTGYTSAQLSVADLLRNVPGMSEALLAMSCTASKWPSLIAKTWISSP